MSKLLKLSLLTNGAFCILVALLLFKSPRASHNNAIVADPQATEAAVEKAPDSFRVSQTETAPSAVVQLAVAASNLHARRNEEHAPVSVPLALQSIDAAALNLTADQVSELLDIRETFVTAIGGPNPNRNDPDYRSRWLQAQADSDDSVRGLLGVQTWLDIETQTGTASVAQTN